ncbi:MAG: alpha-amylase family glycosyl hydrolase [Pseudomonadota bacterium]
MAVQNMDDWRWWQDAVIYQIYPRSFQDSDADGIGDLNGIRQRLPYVAKLGVDGIWICPFVRSPMRDFGYDVSDFCAIEPLFGTLADFDALVQEAHNLGLRVLMDQVWNHTSDEHPWFIESRSSKDNSKSDWYVWADAHQDGGPPNNWRATFGGSAWEWDPTRHQYFLHNFLAQQPDLNWYNPDVRKAMVDIGRFWLDRGVDGFRLDVANFYAHDRTLKDNPIRPSDQPRPAGAALKDPYFDFINEGTVCRPETLNMLKDIRLLMNEYPNTVALGEVSSAEDSLLAAADYIAGDHRLHLAYNASLISYEPFTARGLHTLFEHIIELFPQARLCWTFGTHDFPRLRGRWANHGRHSEEIEAQLDRLLPSLLIGLPGSCCIYQGDELGLTQTQLNFEQLRDPYGIANYPEILGRDGCRTPMPWSEHANQGGFSDARTAWLPLPAEHLHLAVELQESDPNSLLIAYRNLIRWRRLQPALHGGGFHLYPLEPPLLQFERGEGEQSILCVYNFSTSPHHHQIPHNHLKLIEDVSPGIRLKGRELFLPAYGAAFLKKM